MLDHETAIHHYPESRLFGHLRRHRMNHAFLHPDTARANLNRLFNDRKDSLGAPKDVHQIYSNLFWYFEERGES